jgi:hypothetical protein
VKDHQITVKNVPKEEKIPQHVLVLQEHGTTTEYVNLVFTHALIVTLVQIVVLNVSVLTDIQF